MGAVMNYNEKVSHPDGARIQRPPTAVCARTTLSYHPNEIKLLFKNFKKDSYLFF